MIKEALAEEVHRTEQRKKRSDRATAAVLESEPAASAASTANGSGQRKEKRSIPDVESRVQFEDISEMGIGESTALPGAPSANTRRRIVVVSEPAAATTQAVDGHCEKGDENRECRTN